MLLSRTILLSLSTAALALALPTSVETPSSISIADMPATQSIKVADVESPMADGKENNDIDTDGNNTILNKRSWWESVWHYIM